MIEKVQKKSKAFVTSQVAYLPTITVMLPCDLKVLSRKQIEESLRRVLQKAEKELIGRFTSSMVKPALNRLVSILNNVNHPDCRSIAVFLSPFAEKILYLNIPVKEKVVVGNTFSARDLVNFKKEEHEVLLLVLNSFSSNLYLKTPNKLSLLVTHAAIPYTASVSDLSFCRNTSYFKKKCEDIDQSLSLILKNYRLPLLVAGDEKRLSGFIKNSKNVEYIVQFLPREQQDRHGNDYYSAFELNEEDWQRLKFKSLLLELERTAGNGKLAVGIEEVWQGIQRKKASLLVVERSYVYPIYKDVHDELIFKTSLHFEDAEKIKDAVEEVIEQVLKDGGKVEFVEDGQLKDYMHIAVIYK